MFFVATDAEHDGCASAEIAGSAEEGNDGIAPRTEAAVQPAGLGSCAGGEEPVADTESKRQQRERTRREQIGRTRSCAREPERCGFVCDTMRKGLQDGEEGKVRQSSSREQPKRSDCWAAEPDVGRVAHGIPNRVDRIKCLGNAVVPQQAYPIFKALREAVFDGMEEDAL